jgi:hypothetical protein
MTKEDISVLEVVWYETFNETKAIPTAVEGQVLQNSLMKTGRFTKMECSF